METNPDHGSCAIRVCSGAARLFLALVALEFIAPEVIRVDLVLRVYFGSVYLLLIRAILWEVWDRIARGQEALEILEAAESDRLRAAESQELVELAQHAVEHYSRARGWAGAPSR